jgi:hypothetical protein
MQVDEVTRSFHRNGWIYEEKYEGRDIDKSMGPCVYFTDRGGPGFCK